MGLLAPLIILRLGGGVIYVGVATFLYYLASTLGSMFWGWVADVVPRRRPFLVAGAALISAAPIGMGVSGSVLGVMAWYSVGAFAYALLVVYLNLLAVESLDRGLWNDAARRGFVYLMTGSLVGTALGLASVMRYSLLGYAAISTAVGAAGAIPLLASVKEPPVILERRALLVSPSVFVSRLASLPMIFLSFPKLFDIAMLRKRIRRMPGSELTILTIVNALFSLSAQLFFTVYIPYESSAGLDEAQILLSFLYMSAINVLAALLMADELRRPSYLLASRGMGLRALGMLLTASFAAFATGVDALYASLLSFTFIGFAYTMITVTMNALLYASLVPGTRGRSLGAYSTIGSLSFMAGALLSGILARYAGYQLVFLLAAAVLMAAAAAMEVYYRGSGSTLDSINIY